MHDDRTANPPSPGPDPADPGAYRPEWADTDGGFRGGGWDVSDEGDTVRLSSVAPTGTYGRAVLVTSILVVGVAIPATVLLLDDDPAFFTPQKIVAFLLYIFCGVLMRAGAARIMESIPSATFATWHRPSGSLRIASGDRVVRGDRIECVELIWVSHQRSGGPNSPERHCVLLVKDAQGRSERIALGFAAHNLERVARRLAELVGVPLVRAADLYVRRPKPN